MEKQNYNKVITKLLSQQNCNFFEENVSKKMKLLKYFKEPQHRKPKNVLHKCQTERKI